MGIDSINNSISRMQQGVSAQGGIGQDKDINGRENEQGSLLYAGNLNLPKAPADKVDNARKQAMKLVKDAFEKDRETDRSLDEIRKARSRTEDDLAWRQDTIDSARERVAEYAKANGITSDSREQKDLDLIRKARDMKREEPDADPSEYLSEDEIDRLSHINEKGLTENQRLALETDDEIRNTQSEIDNDKELIKGYNTAIQDIGIESLKDQGMLKAGNAKDAIMQTAYDEAVKSVVQDAVERMDEEQDEIKEAAEEKAEKKAEAEEKAEKREEEKKEREILEGQAELRRVTARTAGGESQGQVNTGIQNILNKLGLLEEDIKGIEVSENI